MGRMSLTILLTLLLLMGCSSNKSNNGNATSSDMAAQEMPKISFDGDSAYFYVDRQVAFGPRVPNTEAHRKAGDWLVGELKRHGAEVIEQKMKLKAFDGTILDSRNIMGRINPDAQDRMLLVAHWDCRPWADNDPDESNHSKPVDGANDGASGVGVLLEIARQMKLSGSDKGVDILFVDAEDWGEDSNEESWAMGTRYFAQNPPVEGYAPKYAVLLDMVGGKDAVFCREYFSEQAAPAVADRVWSLAAKLGHGDMFRNRMGTAVTDDHVELIKGGIPAIDIIEYHPGSMSGFNERWHTASDNMEGIDKKTLQRVGQVVMALIMTE